MDKRLAVIGGIMFIAGVLMVVVSTQSVLSALPNSNNTFTQKAYVPANSVVYYPIQLISASFIAIGFNSTTPLSFYLVNSSAYAKFLPYIKSNESLRNISDELEGKGVVVIMLNASKGIFPYQTGYSGLFPAPNYSIQNTTILP